MNGKWTQTQYNMGNITIDANTHYSLEQWQALGQEGQKQVNDLRNKAASKREASAITTEEKQDDTADAFKRQK